MRERRLKFLCSLGLFPLAPQGTLILQVLLQRGDHLSEKEESMRLPILSISRIFCSSLCFLSWTTSPGPFVSGDCLINTQIFLLGYQFASEVAQ